MGKAVEAIIVDLLPNATVNAKLENEGRVLAHAAGASKVHFVRLRTGDRVLVHAAPPRLPSVCALAPGPERQRGGS